MMKQLNEAKKKKLLTGMVSVLATCGIGSIVAWSIHKTTVSDQEEAQITEKEIPPKKKQKKQTGEEALQKTYDTFGIGELSPPTDATKRTALLTPKEIRSVSEKVKRDEQGNTRIPPLLSSPIVKEQPPKKPEGLVPPIQMSKPIIRYQTDIIVVKGEVVSPASYFSVTDELDTNVHVFVEPTTIDTSVVGWQAFTVHAKNKFGSTATETIPFYVASQPVLSVQQERIDVVIGRSFQAMDYVSAMDEVDGDLTDQVRVKQSTVDMEKEGDYVVRYAVQNSAGIQSEMDMLVRVVNDKPTLVATDVVHEINQPFDPLEGVSAVAYNGDVLPVSDIHLLENTVNAHVEGIYFVFYQVSDRFGKASDVVKRRVEVENEAPVIHGTNDLIFEYGTEVTTECVLEGVYATDREDDKQQLPLEVTVDEEQLDTINTNGVGEYPLTYSVTDSMGKTTTETIKVSIVEPIQPMGKKPTNEWVIEPAPLQLDERVLIEQFLPETVDFGLE